MRKTLKQITIEEIDQGLKDLIYLSKKGFSTKMPKKRRECKDVPRPCPYVSCKYNTYIEIEQDGTITIPNKEPWDVDPKKSCVLDIIEDNKSGLSNQQIAEVLDLSRETVRIRVINALSRAKDSYLFQTEDVEDKNVKKDELFNKINNLKDVDFKKIDRILFNNPRASLEVILDDLNTSISFRRYYVIKYTSIVDDNTLCGWLALSKKELNELRKKIKQPIDIRPGEFTLEQLVVSLNTSEVTIRKWVNQGLAYRVNCYGEIIFSRSSILEFFELNSGIFYLLKPTEYGFKSLRLDTL